jgi:hypothetical protein
VVKARRWVAACAVLAVAWGVWTFFPTRTRQVKRVFTRLSGAAEKDGPEGALVTAAAARKLSAFFASECRLEAQAYRLSGTVSRDDVMRYAFAARDRARTSTLRFYDVRVAFGQEGEAVAEATARVEGTSDSGDSLREVHEIRCVLRKFEGEWLFSEVVLVDVLER